MCILNNRINGVLLLVAAILASSAQADQQVLKSTVRIQVITTEGTTRGTGFAVEGGVITAAHVVEKNKNISVICGDGDDSVVYDGEVVFRDTLLDMAFVLIKNDFEQTINFPPVKLDTSFPVQPGVPVFAIGNSLGFTRSVSAGIVSASGKRAGERFLYSDVLTRKGNSGGPLVNAKGEVIGMVTGSIDFSPVGQPQVKDSSPEFAYTIPAQDVVDFLERAKSKTKLNGYLGVLGTPVSTGMNQPGCDRGLQIMRTTRPCGLQPGDIVFMLADVPISSQRDIARVVRAFQPGLTKKADIIRNGQFKTIDVYITEIP